MSTVFHLAKVVFYVSLALFLAGGLFIVLAQFAGLVALDGAWVLWAGKKFSKIVYSCAAVCAVSAFVLNYQKAKQ
ncbi:hypothetical protein [Corynebacterium hindlerae]|uniref:hypothetical protein n=2 Tax=Corynebacteriaceae TaxID=1653 RepID=UPI0031B68701